MSMPQEDITPLLVLSHCYEEHLDVYRLVIGREVFIAAWSEPSVDPESPDEPIVVDHDRQVVRHEDVRDYVFAGDDERWFTDGKRNPDADVAQLQKEIVKQTIEEIAASTPDIAPPREMPGIGDEL